MHIYDSWRIIPSNYYYWHFVMLLQEVGKDAGKLGSGKGYKTNDFANLFLAWKNINLEYSTFQFLECLIFPPSPCNRWSSGFGPTQIGSTCYVRFFPDELMAKVTPFYLLHVPTCHPKIAQSESILDWRVSKLDFMSLKASFWI